MRFSTIFALIILAIVGLMIVTSLGYSRDAKLFPLMIAIPIAALAVAQIASEVWTKTEPKEMAQEKKVVTRDVLRNYLVAPAWIAALLLITYLVGLLAGFLLFTFLYLRLHRQSWLLSIIVTLVMAAVIYGGFAIAFQVPLYKGVLFF